NGVDPPAGPRSTVPLSPTVRNVPPVPQPVPLTNVSGRAHTAATTRIRLPTVMLCAGSSQGRQRHRHTRLRRRILQLTTTSSRRTRSPPAPRLYTDRAWRLGASAPRTA